VQNSKNPTVVEDLLKQPTAIEEEQPTAVVEKQLSTEDELFTKLLDSGLVNETFKSWYCGAFYRLGRGLVLELAGKALIQGKDPQKYFSYLVKRQLVK
jgi:hypothetical protein